MPGRIWLVGALLFGLWKAPVQASEATDPFAGKTLDEIKQFLEKRMEERKEAREFLSDYQSFAKREGSKLSRTGKSLCSQARVWGEYMQAEYLFRFGEYEKCLKLLRALEKNARKLRRQNRLLLHAIYLLMGSAFAYLEKPPDAQAALRRARNEGAIGSWVNDIGKRLLEHAVKKKELRKLISTRNLDPKGGKEPGDKQWQVCLHYQAKIYLPVEEAVEIAWMIESFPEHTSVKGGDAHWAQIQCADKLNDNRTVIQLCGKFKDAFPHHWAQRQGDILWVLARAYYGKGNNKEAKKYAQNLKRKHPKFRKVESKDVDNLIGDCDRGTGVKDRFKQGNPWNQWWKSN
jgi:tetratricopeptide (TPR) repeat protein